MKFKEIYPRLKPYIYPQRRLIDGIDIRDVTLESLKRNLSLVDQESFLFNGTIDYNIRFGAQQASDEAVRAAARQAHADEFINALPEGYQTRIGNRGLRLSGGQRQRICIADGLYRKLYDMQFRES